VTTAPSPDFRARLRAGTTLLGTLCTVADPDVVERVAGAGPDWLFLDGEHGSFAGEGLRDALRAAGPVPCLVRVPSVDGPWIGRALDAGAAGIIVPQVRAVDDVRRAIAQSQYAPAGTRGVGAPRARWLDSGSSVALSDDRVVVVAQIETGEALDALDALLDLNRLDALFIGPNDLAAALGHPGRLDHPDVRAAILQVAARCSARARPCGIFATTAAALAAWRVTGITMPCVGVDLLLLEQALRQQLQDARA
jgi:2-keto-3-deoxy-L-rhamnonate aldolase RhmA